LAALEHVTRRRRIRTIPPRRWQASLLVFITTRPANRKALPPAGAGSRRFPRIPATAYKGRERGHRVYVNRWARAAIAAIRTDDDLIFSWHYGAGWLSKIVRDTSPGPNFGCTACGGPCANELQLSGHDMMSRLHLGHHGKDCDREALRQLPRQAPVTLEDPAAIPQPCCRLGSKRPSSGSCRLCWPAGSGRAANSEPAGVRGSSRQGRLF